MLTPKLIHFQSPVSYGHDPCMMTTVNEYTHRKWKLIHISKYEEMNQHEEMQHRKWKLIHISKYEEMNQHIKRFLHEPQ